MSGILETERLILRAAVKADADSLLGFYKENRIFFKPWVAGSEEDFYTSEYQKKLIEHFQESEKKGSEFRFWIFKKDSLGKVIGNISVSNIVRGIFQSAFLGYCISENENRNGFATETVKRVIEFSFNDLKLHRLEANIIPANKASLRIVEKLNFIKEGYSEKYLKINNKWEDHIKFAILNENYR